jgi:hypothetical protein
VRAAALAAAAALLACGPRRPPPDLSLDPAELLAQVKGAQERVRSVQGEARVSVDASGTDGTVSQFIAAEKPDRLHVEVLDFFGNVAAVLVAGDGRFALYDARAKVLYRGAATPANLSRLVPLPLPAEDLVTILCGSAPLARGVPASAIAKRGAVELELEGDGRWSQWLRIGAGAAVERSALRAAATGAPAPYSLAFDVFRTRAGARFPTDLRLEADAPRVRLELHWTEVAVNATLDPALFRLETPRGARVVELGPGDEAPPPLYPAAAAPEGPAGDTATAPSPAAGR